MHPLALRLWLIIAALSLGACQKKAEAPGGTAPSAKSAAGKPTAVEVVRETERSASFAAVNRHLELGGTLYGYVDIDGDVLQLTAGLQTVLGEMAKAQPQARIPAQLDLAAIAKSLGLTDVKALGASSVPDGNGFFRNRLFIHTGGERHGLMAALGGKPAPFKHLGLAPADAAFFGETEMDLGVLYRTLREVVSKVAGEPASNEIEKAINKAGEMAAISLLDLIHGLKGRSAVVLRVDGERTMRLPGQPGFVLPAISVLVCVDGIGQIIEPALAKSALLRRSDAGAAHVYEFTQPLPIEGLQPAIVIDGSTLFVTTSLAFLKECREQKSGLAQTPEYQKAIAQLGAEGNGLTYVSPKFFERVAQIEKLNPSMPAESLTMLRFVMNQMPKPDRPLVAVRTNLDDGILVRSYLNRSLKQDLATVSIYNPITIGMLAAMAIPAFQKVRVASQEKAVTNNLRQLAAAADQHYLETGTTTATYDQIVGPSRYVRVINPVMGENYRALRFQSGQPLRVRLSDGRTIQYPMN